MGSRMTYAVVKDGSDDPVLLFPETVSGCVVDVFSDEPIWGEPELDEEMASLGIRVSPIFRD